MIPDLGRYATEVMLAYGVSLALIAAIVLVSVARARKVARDLDAAEGRRGPHED